LGEKEGKEGKEEGRRKEEGGRRKEERGYGTQDLTDDVANWIDAAWTC
jgi:hypothetical protein